MLFVFILPFWFIFVCAASIFLLFKHTRLLGGYLISASTLGLLGSFVASMLGLFGMWGIGEVAGAGEFKGPLIGSGFMIGLLLGGVSGAWGGVALVHRLHKKALIKAVQP
jgi:hypothetical protein